MKILLKIISTVFFTLLIALLLSATLFSCAKQETKPDTFLDLPDVEYEQHEFEEIWYGPYNKEILHD